MAELWQSVVETLRRRPGLWLPVLVADVLGYLVSLGRTGLLQALILHNTAQQSVLGGAVTHGPMSASAMQSTTIVAVLLTWSAYFLRLLFYTCAFIATAALIQAFRERVDKPVATVGPALARFRGGILELALRALAIYAVAALLLNWATSSLLRHGQTALLRSPWASFGMGLAVALTLSTLLPPAALRVLAGRAPGPETQREAQIFSAILVITATLLSTFVAANSREMAHVPPAARYPLEIIGSLVVALPYVLLFTGLTLLARRTASLATNDEAA